MSDLFDGEGYDQGELTPEERARFRHMFRTLNENFIPLSDADLATLQLLTPVRRAWWILPISLAVGAALSKLGIM